MTAQDQSVVGSVSEAFAQAQEVVGSVLEVGSDSGELHKVDSPSVEHIHPIDSIESTEPPAKRTRLISQ